MRLHFVFALLILCQPVFSQSWCKATVLHKKYGVLHGQVYYTTDCLFQGSPVFKHDSSALKFNLHPGEVKSVDIPGIGTFESHIVDLPKYDDWTEEVSKTSFTTAQGFFKMVYNGRRYSLLEWNQTRWTLFFLLDHLNHTFVPWRWKFVSFPTDYFNKEYFIESDYKDQLTELTSKIGLVMPKRIIESGYDKESLVEITKFLNYDSFVADSQPFSPGDLDMLSPKWAASIRLGTARQRYVEYLKHAGPVYEVSISREIHKNETEILQLGVSFEYSQSSGRRKVAGQDMRLQFREYSVRPFIMGAVSVGRMFHQPAFFGMRLGYNFPRYTEQYSVDGQAGKMPSRHPSKYVMGELILHQYISRRWSAELGLGGTYHSQFWPVLHAGLNTFYRW